MPKETSVSMKDFIEVHGLFIEAVTSESITNVRYRLKQMKVLDECRARECCLKTLCRISSDNDYMYSPVVKDIIESELFKHPHNQSLRLVTPTLIYNAARFCTSTKSLHQTVSYLAAQSKSNITDTLNTLGDDGYSALHLSAMSGGFKATAHILELGPDCSKKSENGNSAISLAIAYGHDSLVPLLLNRSDVNSHDSDHDTPLMFAAWNNAPQILSSLIQCGADVNKRNKYGSNSIWNAVYQSNAECVLILLSNNSKMNVSCEGTDLFFNEDDCGDKITKLYPGHERSLLWVAVDRIGFSVHSLKVLFILLEAGYDVTKEHWLRNESPPDCPNTLQKNPALTRMLQFQYKHPQNLKDLCRNSLREHHQLSHLPFHKWLRRLCLPSSLESFLLLSYIN